MCSPLSTRHRTSGNRDTNSRPGRSDPFLYPVPHFIARWVAHSLAEQHLAGLFIKSQSSFSDQFKINHHELVHFIVTLPRTRGKLFVKHPRGRVKYDPRNSNDFFRSENQSLAPFLVRWPKRKTPTSVSGSRGSFSLLSHYRPTQYGD